MDTYKRLHKTKSSSKEICFNKTLNFQMAEFGQNSKKKRGDYFEPKYNFWILFKVESLKLQALASHLQIVKVKIPMSKKS